MTTRKARTTADPFGNDNKKSKNDSRSLTDDNKKEKLFDGVVKGADAVDVDVDYVSTVKGEGVGRDDACSGEQKTSVRKAVVAKEVFDQCRRIAFQFG
jgi:hypothetical protein